MVRCKSYLMQPSSRRVGPTSARSSASSRVSWPGLGRRITTSVTAFLGSFPEAVARDLCFGARLLGLRFGIVGGIVLQVEKSESATPLKPFVSSGSLLCSDAAGVQVVEIQDCV